MNVVINTNILSSLWSRDGAPARFMENLLTGFITPCFDYRIISEYQEVLCRPKFRFSKGEVNSLLDWIISQGISVIPDPLCIEFSDISDKKFYEVAKFCNAYLVTGNIKHYPKDDLVITVTDYLKYIDKSNY